MSATAQYADELVTKIDEGELDPSEVSIQRFVDEEMTVLTPELAERLPDEKIEEYNERVARRDERDLRDERKELAAEQEETLTQLEAEIRGQSDEDLTETITIGEAELTVRTKIPGRVEEHLDAVSEQAKADVPSLTAVKDNMIGAILGLIVDDSEPDDDPHTFCDREAWDAFYAEHGSEDLYDLFEIVSGPAMERRERIEKFRDERRRGQRH